MTTLPADPVPIRARLPLLVLGFISLATGVAGGLVRAGAAPLPVPDAAIALHGVVMVSGFFGTVISLERVVALGRRWAYGAPLACGAGGLLVLAGATLPGFVLMALGSALLAAANVRIVARQPSRETATLLAGAGCWLTGNLLVVFGAATAAALPWWIAFFVLTIGGERLELARYAPRPPGARHAFVALATAVTLAPLFAHLHEPAGNLLLGASLVAFALWLFLFDIARITVRQCGLTRYIALCLLAGYMWLAFGGALMIGSGTASAGPLRDAWIHALMVGFVFSMVFGHAPVILPAVLRVPMPWSAWLYLPAVLLHLSLLARVAGDLADAQWLRSQGAIGNALSIALFILGAVTLVLRRTP